MTPAPKRPAMQKLATIAIQKSVRKGSGLTGEVRKAVVYAPIARKAT